MEAAMKKIIINGDVLCAEKIFGISRVAFELMEEIDKQLFENNIELDIQVCYPIEKTENKKKYKKVKSTVLGKGKKRFVLNVLRKYVRKERGIFCSLSNNIAIAKNSLILVHDIRALDNPKYDTVKNRIYQVFLMKSIKYTRSRVVTVSQYQKERIMYICGIDSGKIFVIGNGWEHIKKIKSDEEIFSQNSDIKRNEYYYTLGSLAKHKNYEWIVNVALANPFCTFVIAGDVSYEKWGIDEKIFSDIKNIIFTGYVTDEENKALLENCRGFLHPSKYEGFGIPPLEALALGKPVAVSSDTCLPEIFGDAVHYFDSDNYNIDMDELFRNKVESPENVLEKYTWKNAAKEWIKLFNELECSVQ